MSGENFTVDGAKTLIDGSHSVKVIISDSKQQVRSSRAQPPSANIKNAVTLITEKTSLAKGILDQIVASGFPAPVSASAVSDTVDSAKTLIDAGHRVVATFTHKNQQANARRTEPPVADPQHSITINSEKVSLIKDVLDEIVTIGLPT